MCIRDRESAEALSGLAGVFFVRGENAQAEEYFRRALQKTPEDPDLWFNLGNCLVVQERPREAEDAYRKAIELDPGANSAAARLNFGVILLTRVEVEEAEAQFRKATQVNPSLPGPWLHLARIASARYRLDEAREHYRRYRETVPDAGEKARTSRVLKELETRIAERDASLARGEVHLLQLVTDTREEMDKALQRVDAGEDFYVVADKMSRVAKVTGVDIGYVDPSGLHQTFAQAVEALEVGERTAPLEGPRGWYVFLRVE